METALLATKLYIPPPRPNLVSRPRLTERLNEGLACKLTLISAPAGFGKTTLLSDWIHNGERPVAWVSLDEGDNDVVRFLAYFIAALQTIVPDIGEGVLNALQSASERIPVVFYLRQNYPNPFNPLTTIEYGLPMDEEITVTIYDILGQKVTVLVDKRQPAGRYKIQFDAGKVGMASGIYFYQIRTGGFVKSRKMLLLK